MSNATSSSTAKIRHGQPAPLQGGEGVSIPLGENVGDYVIEEQLGHGTEGEVYLGRDVLLGRRVALKTLRSTSIEATHGVEEARLMAALEHPNIVRVYHAQRYKGVWLVVFEHIAGGSLHAHVERAGPLPPARAVELLAQAAAGLGYAHEFGILHRDVKPQNLLLSHRGELKLADFGLALDARRQSLEPLASQRTLARHSAVGTPAFLAPELWHGGAPSAASDIYGLGACLYFALTGRVPFPFSTLEQLERAHRELLPKLPEEVPTGIRHAVLGMLAKDPAERPGPSSQLALELNALARDPTRLLRSSPLRSTRLPESPIVAGGTERALEVVWSEGPGRAYLERLLELLQQGWACVQLQSKPLQEARGLLRIALGRCVPSRRVALRLELPTPATSPTALALQKTALPPSASLVQLCEQLAAEQAALFGGSCVLEVLATAPPSERQAQELAALAAAAKEREIAIVLLSGADAPFASHSSALPGFELLHLPEAWGSAPEFAERVRLWLSVATARRSNISADAVRLLRHLCSQQVLFWPQLLQDSLLISAAARLPLLTSWAVQASLAHSAPLHAPSDVPVEWRVPPRRWPSPKLSALLSELRRAEHARELRPAAPAAEEPTTEAAPETG